MSTPQTVVVDCSATAQPDPGIVSQLRNEAIALLDAGNLAEADNVMAQARDAAAATNLAATSVRDLTAEELAQHDLDQAAGLEAAAAQQTLDTNAASLRDKTAKALSNLEAAAGNWSTLTAEQKDAAMTLTVQVTARLARLALSQLDAAP